MPTVILNATQNTFVASTYPNSNLSYYPLLYTGTDTILGTCISLLKYDFAAVSANSVENAVLELSVFLKPELIPSTVQVSKMAEAFEASQVTYSTTPALVPTQSEIQITTGNLYKTVQIDITGIVNDWLSGLNANYCLALTNSVPNTMVQFGSDKIEWAAFFPKLVLNYSIPDSETTDIYPHTSKTEELPVEKEGRIPPLAPVDEAGTDTELKAAIDATAESSVDPLNIYVDSSSEGGVGNSTCPLRTVEEALAAVSPGGTLYIRGTFDVAGTIVIAKEGITLLGVENPEFVVNSDSLPLIINAPNVTLDGISITNTAYRPSELIRIMSNSAKIVNCNLTGCGKPTLNRLMDGITTVGESAGNFVIKKNRITALGAGIRLLSLSGGVVTENNIWDSINGICIDGGTATITGNSWSGSPNETDILITSNNQSRPLEDNVKELSLLNNEAVVIDKRSI